MDISEVTIVHAVNPEQLEKEINAALGDLGREIKDIKITSSFDEKYSHMVYVAVIMY